MVVTQQNDLSDFNSYAIERETLEVKIPLNFKISRVDNISNVLNTIIFVDEEKITFPLEIRKWREGDFFYPSGMNGKKKLSKYFKDEKMSYFDKQNQWLLCDGSEILWVVGMRFDKRKYITKNANIKIEFNEV